MIEGKKIGNGRDVLLLLLLLILVLVSLLAFLSVSFVNHLYEIQTLGSKVQKYEQVVWRDSVGNFTYLMRNDSSIISYEQLLIDLNDTRAKLNQANRNVLYEQEKLLNFADQVIQSAPININFDTWSCSPSSTWLLAKQLLVDDNGQISYYTRNGAPVSYNEIAHQKDSIRRLLVSKCNECSVLQTKLDLIRRRYPIDITENDSVISVRSATLDSAVMLLPYYRDMLRLADDGKTWIITHTVTK